MSEIRNPLFPPPFFKFLLLLLPPRNISCRSSSGSSSSSCRWQHPICRSTSSRKDPPPRATLFSSSFRLERKSSFGNGAIVRERKEERIRHEILEEKGKEVRRGENDKSENCAGTASRASSNSSLSPPPSLTFHHFRASESFG